MHLTNPSNGAPSTSSFPANNNNRYGTSNGGQVIQGRPVGSQGFNTFNNGGTNRSGVCYNCGKMGHFAQDCWAGRGRMGQPSNFDPELEEIREQHRLTRKEKQELEEKRKMEEDKKAKEEEQARRDRDFARKAEEFKLQLRPELHEEWRKKKSEVEAATRASAKERGSPAGRKTRTLRRSRRKRRTNKRYVIDSSESDTNEDSEQSESLGLTTESELTVKRRSSRKGKKRPSARNKTGKRRTKERTKSTPPTEAPGAWKGECSKQTRMFTRGKKRDSDSSDPGKEPRTPMTTGYKDLVDRLRATTHRLEAEGCQQAVGRCYDIKEMFSRIPHEAVLQSVHQLLRHFEDFEWKQVKLSFRGRACNLNKTARKQDGYVSIRLKNLLKAVEFDLQHSFIRCGTRVMKQIFGIPMGKSTSPVLASITCAMAEERFLRALGTDRKLISGWRIMDDILLVAGLPSSGYHAGFPLDFFNLFESSYDSSLKIVRNDECGLTWEFVGGTMMIGSEPLQLHYIPRSKNTDSLFETGNLKFQTLQDYASYSDKKVKKAVLSATLKRLWDQSTSKPLVLGTIAFTVCETHLRGYPPEVSLGALANLAKAAENGLLRKMLDVFTAGTGFRKFG
ncbi:hypothetical protein CBR_g27944 [Chara braunii]|uniref:CCHC-type domain-containing protein n=1 Tax=Chara braunii TaxID=69332 RepID=A0A388L8S6_CHABU|nr:hypothetical protein CBR_g27944 [Chara braunii]|eukprot:GBG78719.1 hypothetical protein CBR_g27944 [Chara braunii]